jgi:hypothetical protein
MVELWDFLSLSSLIWQSASNVERLHKVYSVIHCASRNRLQNARVERLSHATLIARAASKPKPTFPQSSLDKFATMSEDELKDLVEWADLVSTATKVTANTRKQPSEHLSIAVEPDVKM